MLPGLKREAKLKELGKRLIAQGEELVLVARGPKPKRKAKRRKAAKKPAKKSSR